MKGLKAAGNSCITSRTRKLSIEVELGHLAVAFRAHMAEALKMDEVDAQEEWQNFWPRVKSSTSYTVRVNGRVIVKKGRVLSKTTRKKIAALKRRRERELA
jgi:hypothetical protein